MNAILLATRQIFVKDNFASVDINLLFTEAVANGVASGLEKFQLNAQKGMFAAIALHKVYVSVNRLGST